MGVWKGVGSDIGTCRVRKGNYPKDYFSSNQHYNENNTSDLPSPLLHQGGGGGIVGPGRDVERAGIPGFGDDAGIVSPIGFIPGLVVMQALCLLLVEFRIP